jgi:hypothetical protein
MSRKRTYKPEARDGDGDGLVQDGTVFERPIGTELTADEISERLNEQPEQPPTGPAIDSEAIPAPEQPNTHIAENGDSYALLADRYPVHGLTKHQRATELFHINNASKIVPGNIIKLQEAQ